MDARSMRGQNESSEPAGATAAAVAPAGSLDSFCPLHDLASIISDNRRDKEARHAEKPYPARKVQDLPSCYVRSSGFLFGPTRRKTPFTLYVAPERLEFTHGA